ncbi:hypothetical protein Ddye_029790 [Dipteronia dyeriana]|uniref:Thioredoxin domain-containing protein n=1 Tax=Dipteronia dyeriana TaxID=168575 RepID=A0AAD9WM55_9ROSI|nr:hypothetical protein Ddye_029790 [Dipteronia dyeriana]
MRGNSIYRRFLLHQRQFSYRSSVTPSLTETLISPSKSILSQNTLIPKIPLSNNRFCISEPYLQFRRPLCSSAPDGPSNIIPIKSEEEFNSSLSKVQDRSLPAIYYFTAAWCGPCRFISPVVGDLSTKYPHVTTYKIDIDQEGLRSTLSKLNIAAVPTLHFFQNGKMVAEVVGADILSLKNTADKLYNKDD